MKKSNLLGILLVLLIVMSLFVSACAPARKPAVDPNPNTNPKRDILPNNYTVEQGNDAQEKAEMIARVCDAVPGVESSTVVISGNTCYVGLDIKGNMENKETKRVEKNVSDKAIAADPGIKRCVVVSDVDTVSRLKDIYQGIRRGTPLSTFGKELEEIGRRIMPSVNP